MGTRNNDGQGVALGIMIAGCLCVALATHLDTFAVVLAALFIIASGITILQVAANPLAALLGPAHRSHFRLTLSQAFNSLGTAIAPYLASSVILAGGMFAVQGGLAVTAAQRTESLRHVDFAFLVIAGLIALLALFIWSVHGRLTRAVAGGDRERDASVAPALRSGWALLAAAAAVAAILCLTVTRASGEFAGWAALSVGLVNSIMFPVIFTLTLERSTASGAATSGLLCMAIVGGAVLPPLVGHIADVTELRTAYVVPLIAYACISAFGVAAFRARIATQLATASTAAH